MFLVIFVVIIIKITIIIIIISIAALIIIIKKIRSYVQIVVFDVQKLPELGGFLFICRPCSIILASN